MRPSATGDIVLELWVAPDDSSDGALPGSLPSGEWRAQVDIEALDEETDIHLQAYAEFGPVPAPAVVCYPTDHVVREEVGWYKGELHAHSTESDGHFSVDTVVQASMDAGLDFLSLSDHFTVSQWRKMARWTNDRLALIRSCEVTSHRGHANLQGICEWVDVYVDRPGWNMNDVADATHRQGGLFCVNHAFSGTCSWRVYDFDWSKADLIEICHSLEGPNNDYQVSLWDRHLSLGRRIVGVAGTDTHKVFDGIHKLGELVTWVYAKTLSERAIIEGLRLGQVYVSRGPEVRFSAVSRDGARAEMWETLPLGSGPVTLNVQVKHGQPMWLFMFRNGYILDVKRVAASTQDWQTFTFEDDPQDPAFYRLELHDIYQDEVYSGFPWRNFATMQAMSNPIWVGWSDAATVATP